MATCVDPKSEEKDSDEEHANVALMARTSTSEVLSGSGQTTDDE